MYSYRKSLKSFTSDELINTYLLRPLAGLIVRILYKTTVTPNQVTIASMIAGFAAAVFYIKGTAEAFVIAGMLVTIKDLLDSADGQLARAKDQYSRSGRFLDSIGDFVVDIALFSAIGYTLFQQNNAWWMLILAFLGLVGISLRVSYHVFYQVNFLHLKSDYANNRVSEEVRDEDLKRGGSELILQQIFQHLYGWQDRLIARIDRWSYRGSIEKEYFSSHKGFEQDWYSDEVSLRISGFLGFGTELFLLMLCSVFNNLELYLYLNLFLMNGILLISVFYRRIILLKTLKSKKEW